MSGDKALNRLCLRNPDGIPRKAHSYKAGTYFDFEDDEGIATVLDEISISWSRARHGDKEFDTVFGVSTVGHPYGIDALGVDSREGVRRYARMSLSRRRLQVEHREVRVVRL